MSYKPPLADAEASGSAAQLLSSLLSSGFKPEKIDELHDFLKLLGVVIGQVTLLTVATSSLAEAAPRVSAAKALLDIKETPESLAERLRHSQFAHLTVANLETLVSKIREGDTDIPSLIASTTDTPLRDQPLLATIADSGVVQSQATTDEVL